MHDHSNALANTAEPPPGLSAPAGSVLLTKEKVMEVLSRNLEEAGNDMTVRRFNKILTDLGFTLSDPSDHYPKPSPNTPHEPRP